MSHYTEIRTLTSQGIRSKALVQASSYLDAKAHGSDEPSRSLDNELLEQSQENEDPIPLLCLRCRVSHPLEAWIRTTYKQYHQRYELEMAAMASYALDDQATLTIPTSPSDKKPFTYAEIRSMPKGLISPFSAEVLRTYDPHQCGLPHWSRLKLQCNSDLKSYLKQQGLLLISDEALLNDSSSKRVRESWAAFGKGGFTTAQAVALHGRYLPLYKQAKELYKANTGKASGWHPDREFLHTLNPNQPTEVTHDQLIAIAKSIRVLLSGSWQKSISEQPDQTLDIPDPASLSETNSDESSPQEQLALINASLNRAMDAWMPQEMAREQDKFEGSPERLKAWELYSQGLSHRQIAPRCEKQQPWVSKLIDETRRSSHIATAAANELKRHPAFTVCFTSVEATEQLVSALRNHLINSEREGEVAPFRRWIHQHLSPS